MSTANQKPTESVSLNAFKQPKAFYLIFSIELWERFGYYGLQGIMAVYLVKQLGMSEADSITLFSSFSAPVYGLVAIGGWLGDKVLGTKRVIMLGAIVLAIGYALVAGLVTTPVSFIWVWRLLRSVTACLKLTRLLCFLHAMRKTTASGRCIHHVLHVRQHRLFLLYDCYAVAGREIRLECCVCVERCRPADHYR